MTKRRLAQVPRRYWSAEEDAVIRECWPRVNAKQLIARDVVSRLPGRTLHAVRGRAFILHVSGEPPRMKMPADWKARLVDLHRQGYLDSEIAEALQVTRRHLAQVRRFMGLGSNANNQRHRDKVSAKTRQQVAAAGLKSLAEVRCQRFKQFAVDKGWPADLRPRGVQILEILLAEPALTRQQICQRTGMPWKGSRKSLVSNDPEGSYLANLAKRGLVVASPKIHFGAQGKRKGCGTGLRVYSPTDLAKQMKADFLNTQKDLAHAQQVRSGDHQQHDHEPPCQPTAGAGAGKADRRSTRHRRRQAAG